MEEMLDDTLESVDMDEEMEEEADAEVDKVLFEITDGKLGQAGTVGTELPVCTTLSYCCASSSHALAQPLEGEEVQELERMNQRLTALLSD